MDYAAPATIISLIASATEIVCALGLRDRLVGVSHECDFPDDVKGLPVLSAPKVDPALPGGEIDRQVRRIAADGLSVYRILEDELARLRPDLIVTQDQCEVCAVSLGDVERAVGALTLKATRICSLRPDRLADVFEDFRRVGAAAGVPERGEALAASVGDRLEALRAKTSQAADRPSVACIEWLDPLMIAGGWMPELARIAGGEPVPADDPDVIVIMPCGFTIDRTLAELEGSDAAAPLRRLRATREGRCFVVDGNAYFNRPGPRIADSAEILAGLLHPDPSGEPGSARRWPG